MPPEPPSARAEISKQFYVPVDLSFPIAGMAGVPLAFTAKNSTLTAVGDFGFNGEIDAGYQNGSWGLTAPKTTHANNSPVDAITGVSLGASVVLIAYEGTRDRRHLKTSKEIKTFHTSRPSGCAGK